MDKYFKIAYEIKNMRIVVDGVMEKGTGDHRTISGYMSLKLMRGQI